MSGRLQGRVAIVIGAAQGIGAAIARRFAREGAQVVVADLDEAGGSRLAGELGNGALFHRTDVAADGSSEALAEVVAARFGRIDILVQNAGIYPASLIEETSLDQWSRVLTTNLTGTFLAAKACLPAMRAQSYGRMIFTSSITGPRVSAPGTAAYSASKAGINGFIRTAALEFSGYGITVNGIEPGNIMTEGLTAGRGPSFIAAMTASIPLGRLGTPDDIGAAATYLASEEAGFVTGTTIVVDGGQILPESKAFADPESWS
ncbi:3-oxoacyl-[acyl-carrier protein] reductase [Pseudoxanthobacter soli DSM 19599]|uniref:3-oxoacyl-[acyl-carrier protein] reductase n=1 Tax=Pseudoxanthobacter soli DSM 19599 TaxID=1123029 RepID=A0A1M7ZH72_9HYPH|nr:glucose 1-dehydrogenase [Pseudoxanthobacter soli]SHO64251.1 3-oxoacyl-[acyl-carrier protein] reductase [Pseudoxanthobacter soli DSM 19599]